MIVKIKKIVHISLDSSVDSPKFAFFDCDMTEYGYALIGEQEFSINIPENFNHVPLIVNSLRKEQQKIRLEAEMKIATVEERIQKFLALPSPKSEGKE